MNAPESKIALGDAVCALLYGVQLAPAIVAPHATAEAWREVSASNILPACE